LVWGVERDQLPPIGESARIDQDVVAGNKGGRHRGGGHSKGMRREAVNHQDHWPSDGPADDE
jgi:hypothetical protein